MASWYRSGWVAIALAVIPSAGTCTEPRYTFTGTPGAITSLVISPVAGGRLVGDRMIGGRMAIEGERLSLAPNPYIRPGTCAYARGIRPFTRLRRFGRDGRLQWTWDLARAHLAIALNPGKGGCLSPSGTRLLVQSYDTSEDMDGDLVHMISSLEVIAVGARAHGFVWAKPRGGAEDFSSPLRTSPIRWRKGRPASLDYETDANEEHPGRAWADYSIPPSGLGWGSPK